MDGGVDYSYGWRCQLIVNRGAIVVDVTADSHSVYVYV